MSGWCVRERVLVYFESNSILTVFAYVASSVYTLFRFYIKSLEARHECLRWKVLRQRRLGAVRLVRLSGVVRSDFESVLVL